jgi:hypothetical protein
MNCDTFYSRSRRIITFFLSIFSLALCCFPHIAQPKLLIEPDLIKTFEALDEGTKVTFVDV